MKRTRIISILIIWTLMISLLPAPATLAAGYWVCQQCGRRVNEQVGDICPYCGYERHVHDWAPATCVAPRTCLTCGETEGDPDPANHQGETEVRGRKTVGCTKAGYTGDTYCTACGLLLEKGREIPAQGHQWGASDIIQEATCIEQGKRRSTCAVCGLTLTLETEVDPAHHTGATELRDSRPATCGTAGYTGDTYCLDCGKRIVTGRTIPATGRHTWRAATCTLPKTCTVCGTTQGGPAGHRWDEGRVIYPVTCQKSGLTRFTCTVCGTVQNRVDPMDPTCHTWNEGVVFYPATCTEVGLTHYTCTGCGAEKDEVVPVDPENHAGGTETRNARKATCATEGYSGDIYCLGCGSRIRAGSVIPATGRHTWQAATCTTPKKCKVCGATEGTAKGHTWQAATCTAPKTCKVCGATEGKAKGHTWQAASCTAPKTCKVCGATEGKAKGHTWQAATCTTPKKCKVCGATEGKAKGHTWIAATCTAPKTCKICGATEGKAKGHTWQAATCTAPKTCKVCGATEGKAKGHTWQAATCVTPKACIVCGATEGGLRSHTWMAATCTVPKMCKVCGATEGKAKGHTWQAATCTTPKTCKVCGATEGKAKGHTWQAATVDAPKTCKVCGATEGGPLPAPVTGLKAVEKTRHTITVSWDNMPGAEYYSVYRSIAGQLGMTTVNEHVTAARYTFTGLKPGTPYDIRVRSHAGGEGSNFMRLRVTTLPGVVVGDVVTFGTYPQAQTRNDRTTPIEWQVLDVNTAGHKALLISRYCLDVQKYHNKETPVSWITCSLRAWLNKDFYYAAFNSREQKAILTTRVDNSREQGRDGWTSISERPIQDKVFLLSYAEAWKYFPNDAARMCAATKYAAGHGAAAGAVRLPDGTAAVRWWLRSTGSTTSKAAYVYRSGTCDDASVTVAVFGVRPAMWIDYEAAGL